MSTTETSTVKVELLRRTPHGSPGDIVEVDILEFEWYGAEYMVKSKKTLTCIADQTVPAETIDGDISKESDLSEKETALAEKENELTAKEIELTQKETDLKNREDAIAEKEKAIEGNADKKVEVIK